MSCIGSPSNVRRQSGELAQSECTSARWVLIATILGSSMEFIDGTVTGVSLPAIQSTYHATAVQAEWVTVGYGLFLSSFLLSAGALGDRFGQRRIFGFGTLFFALSSSWCAFAPSIIQLLIARSAQGASGACLVANSLAFLNSSTPLESRGKAIGTWSAVGALMAACGPILGGWLVQHRSWRWVFLLNIPTAAIALWITAVKTKEVHSRPKAASLDLMGAFLGTFSLASLTLGLLEWDAIPLLGFISCLVGTLVAAMFLRWEGRSQNPLLPLTLFQNRLFTGTNLVTLLLYGGVAPMFFYVPIKLIQIQGYSPQEAGAALLPLVLTLSVLSRWAGSLVQRVGSHALLFAGPLTVAVGLFLLATSNLNPDYWARLAPSLFLIGIGLALTVSPLTTAVMSSVEDERAGTASGVNNTVAQVAALLVLAITTPLFQHRFDTSLQTQLVANGISADDSASIWEQRGRLGAIATSNAAGRAAINQAYAQSFAMIGCLAGGLAVLAGVAGAASLRGNPTKPQMIGEMAE
jgi:EmrB/QacA subfamily drug resistance transporter